jgi:hypothetical protein
MDAVKEAESIGISRDYAANYNYTSKGVYDTFTTMSCTASALRTDSLDDNFNLTCAYNTIQND